MARARQAAGGVGWVRVGKAAMMGVMLVFPVAAAPAVTMGGTAGPNGGSVSASGSGFAANDFIQVRWDGRVILANARVDASGKFEIAFRIPADAAPGAHDIRYVVYTPPAQPTCSSSFVSVRFTVKSGGPTPTPSMGTPMPTVAPCSTVTVTPTSTATVTATSTVPVTATTTAVTQTPTVTATVTATTPTSTATVTATTTTTTTTTATLIGTTTSTATKTATSTVTRTATKTATSSVTVIATKTNIPPVAKSPTRVNFPGTGTGGFIDDGDGTSGYTASLVVGLAMLSIGIVSAGFTAARRRTR